MINLGFFEEEVENDIVLLKKIAQNLFAGTGIVIPTKYFDEMYL